MEKIIIIYLAATLVSLISTAILMKKAPFGYSDEKGFHYRRQIFGSKEEAESTLKEELKK